MDPTLEALQNTTKAINDQNTLIKGLLEQGKAAPAAPPVVDAARADDGGAPKKSLAQRLAANRIDIYKGKGLGFARVARAHAIAERSRLGSEHLAGLETKLNLPAGVMRHFGEAAVEQMYSRAMGDSTPSTGGALAFDEYSAEYIEVLRSRLALLKAGVVDVPMDRQSLTIGRQTSDAAGAWIAESNAMSIATVGTDTIQLQLKKWGVQVAVSNDLLHDAVAADVIIRNSMMASAERALDLAMIRGSGTAFTPRGVRNWAVSGNVFGSAAGSGANSLTTALSDLAKGQRVVDEANVPEVKGVFLMAPRTKWGFVQLRDGVGRPYFEEELAKSQPTLMGKEVYTTTQIPTNLSGGGSGGSSESEITYIETSAALLGIGLMPSIEASRDAAYYDGSTTQAAFSRDETVMRVILRADFVLTHNEAASIVTGVTLS